MLIIGIGVIGIPIIEIFIMGMPIIGIPMMGIRIIGTPIIGLLMLGIPIIGICIIVILCCGMARFYVSLDLPISKLSGRRLLDDSCSKKTEMFPGKINMEIVIFLWFWVSLLPVLPHHFKKKRVFSGT